MIEPLVFLIAGLLGLWLGAEILIDSAKKIAMRLGISPFFIGLAFISIGTSIPEIAVSVAGGLDRLVGIETSGLVIGNKVGSAINQITLIIGIMALLVTLRMDRKQSLKHGIMLVGSILLFFVLGLDGVYSKLDGWIAIIVYLTYWVSLFITEKVSNTLRDARISLLKQFFFLALGIVTVVFASDFVVRNGVEVAGALGVKQSLIGILLIGFGTGLPELSVALVSARQSIMTLSIGNLIGSNICDILFSLGTGAIISGFLVEKGILFFDIPMLLLFTLLLLGFLWSKQRVDRREGLLLVGCFVFYVVMKIFYVG